MITILLANRDQNKYKSCSLFLKLATSALDEAR